jgi:hypothetical protein
MSQIITVSFADAMGAVRSNQQADVVNARVMIVLADMGSDEGD